MNNINEMLEERIRKELESLESLESGSDKRSKIIKDITELYKIKIEDDTQRNTLKMENDTRAHQKVEDMMNREIDEQFKKDTIEVQKKESLIRLGVDVIGIMVPIAFYGIWMKKGLKFEETGSFTSQTFKGLVSKFKLK